MFWQHWSKRCPGEQLENSANSGFLGCSVKNIVNSSVLCAIQNAWNRRSLGVLFQHIFFRRLYRQLYFQNHWKNQRFAAFSLKRMVWGTDRKHCKCQLFELQHAKKHRKSQCFVEVAIPKTFIKVQFSQLFRQSFRCKTFGACARREWSQNSSSFWRRRLRAAQARDTSNNQQPTNVKRQATKQPATNTNNQQPTINNNDNSNSNTHTDTNSNSNNNNTTKTGNYNRTNFCISGPAGGSVSS